MLVCQLSLFTTGREPIVFVVNSRQRWAALGVIAGPAGVTSRP